eukprot:5013546-Pleurochrysis_carterae.AAC.2
MIDNRRTTNKIGKPVTWPREDVDLMLLNDCLIAAPMMPPLLSEADVEQSGHWGKSPQHVTLGIEV